MFVFSDGCLGLGTTTSHSQCLYRSLCLAAFERRVTSVSQASILGLSINSGQNEGSRLKFIRSSFPFQYLKPLAQKIVLEICNKPQEYQVM